MLAIVLTYLALNAGTVSPGEIRQVVEQYILTHAGLPASDLLIEFRGTVQPVIVREDNHTTVRVCTEGQATPRGNVSFPVDILAGNTVVKRVYVSVRIRTFGMVCTAAHGLDKHAVLAATDVAVERRETTSLPDDVVTDPALLAGTRTSRMIGTGVPLCASALEEVPVMHANDQITIIVLSGGVRLRVPGVVRDDGRIGETVTVQRITSHRRLRGTVSDASTVVVNVE